ncbi:hypothetical protein FS749_009273 [Ceratobasidium sp. UAMH 11750]|nr:hypothetical protein FS749_009273 [Ceratobasidium sp. UAMH 11750]
MPETNLQLSRERDQTTKNKELIHRRWISLDGNFQNPGKAKSIDPDDVCFTDVDSIFPPKLIMMLT